MIEFRTLRPEELEMWFDHCVYVFNRGVKDPPYKKYFINHLYNDPDMDLEGIHVAVENGKIASTVKVIYRKAYFFGKEITLGGIGEVSTNPEYQGKGLSSRLLRNSIEQMQERKTNISMLSTGIHDFYGRLGWMKTTVCSKVVKVQGSDELPYRIRPVNIDSEASVLKEIYKEYSSRFNGPFVRDNDFYWRMWVRNESPNIWVVEGENNSIIAYVIFHYDDGNVHIKEFCALPLHEDIFDKVAGKLCSLIGKSSMEARFSGLIRTGLKPDRLDKGDHNMYKLITPISLGDTVIDSTEKLIEMLRKDSLKSVEPLSDVLFWDVDGF